METSTQLPLTGVVITRNEGDRLGRCLASMRGVCTELLVLDSGSTDDTVAVARSAGARVEHQDWLGFGPQRNVAMAMATQPWLLLLDADEWLADGTADTLRALFVDGRVEQADAWQLLRSNWFLGTRLRGHEKVLRLVRHGHRYLPMRVHERPDLAGRRVLACDGVIEHDTARSLADHRAKNARYAQLWAEQRHADGKSCSAVAPWTHASAAWIKAIVLKGALFDGRAGLQYHGSHAKAVLRKYQALNAMGRSPRGAAD